MAMVYLTFGEVETLTLLGHKLIKSMYATLSIIQSPPFLKSEHLDFKGKSLRIQWCFKALFVIGFIKFLYMR